MTILSNVLAAAAAITLIFAIFIFVKFSDTFPVWLPKALAWLSVISSFAAALSTFIQGRENFSLTLVFLTFVAYAVAYTESSRKKLSNFGEV